MRIRRIALLVVSFVVAASAPLAAQVRADPGTVINGRVAVRVTVTLSDDETPYAPIGGVSVRFFRTTADTTVSARTDDAGTATVLLPPGEYRLMSTSPVDWKGTRYSWSQLVQVRAGLPTIELTAGLAERSAIVVDAPTVVTGRGPASADASDGDVVLVKKDPALATMLSFFLTGTGQMYSGEQAKGGVLLALTAAGVAMAAKQLSCATASDCEATTGGMALGAAGAVAFFGSWIYGIMDAGDAARRFNSVHGLVAAGARPFVAPAGGGRTRLGLMVALPR
jgi:hypothetical protein